MTKSSLLCILAILMLFTNVSIFYLNRVERSEGGGFGSRPERSEGGRPEGGMGRGEGGFGRGRGRGRGDRGGRGRGGMNRGGFGKREFERHSGSDRT